MIQLVNKMELVLEKHFPCEGRKVGCSTSASGLDSAACAQFALKLTWAWLYFGFSEVEFHSQSLWNSVQGPFFQVCSHLLAGGYCSQPGE